MAPPPLTRERLLRRLDAATGRIPCDLAIRNVRFLDVFSCSWRAGDISVFDGVIASLEPGLKARRSIDGLGKCVVPGFIDAHVHVESSLMLPQAFEQAVLERGTTTAICDPHELANVVGLDGIKYFLDSSTRLHMDLWVMLSSCVPASHLETNGGGEIDSADLRSLRAHPRALGLAEMMNYPGVLGGNEEVAEKLVAFADAPIDGHCPMLSPEQLGCCAVAGVSSCHESLALKEAQDKLRAGLAVWIREGSVAKDANALAPLVSLATSTSTGFCTDDRNPFDIATEGHLDHVLRTAIRAGAPQEAVLRAASWSVARHYGLDRGPQRVGAVAPGYQADLVLLDDVMSCTFGTVLKSGQLVSELPPSSGAAHQDLGQTVRATLPEAEALEGPKGRVNVIVVEPGKLVTGHEVREHTDPGILRVSVLERHGHGQKPANAYVMGFGELRGAIASSVAHDSHNLAVVGNNTPDMRTALGAVMDMGGGFAVARDGKVLARLALPFAGLMSAESPEVLQRELGQLRKVGQEIGCVLDDPFLQLSFVSLPVIPALKLTDRGLVDVARFDVIGVLAS